jgi:intein-encoded DNA endonuclease-like protein
MKTLIILMLAGMIQISATNPLNEKETIRQEIAGEIQKTLPKHLAENCEAAEVVFYINRSGNVHVEYVNSNSEELTEYLKNKLDGLAIPALKEYGGITFRFAVKLLLQ